MLECKYGGGREHRDLLVVVDCLERRAHSHFRLAVANITAEQAIHGLRRLHITLHIANCLLLVFRLAVLEGVFKLLHPLAVRGKGMPLGHFAFGVQLEQLVGHVFHGLTYPSFRSSPGGGAQMAEHRLGAFRGAVFLHQIETGQRDIKPGAFGVLEQHELCRAVTLINFFQALVLPDSVFHVNYIVAHLQVTEI